jgi:undecaprenyl-phosphate 4-deoxy-4-formamido-L-arabinose transferase
MNKIESLSVVIPIYNGATYVKEIAANAVLKLGPLCNDYELIFVDDGSVDSSWQEIIEVVQAESRVIGLKLSTNFGQHNATTAGILHATKKYIVTMDQDMQHKMEDVEKLYDVLVTGYNVVYGVASERPNTYLRNLLTHMAKKALSSVVKTDVIHKLSSFRIFDGRLKDNFINYRGSDIILDVVLIWNSGKVASVSLNVSKAEDSHYSYWKLLLVTIRILVSFSTNPLRISSWIGFAMTIFGMFTLLYVFIVYLTVGSIQGFTFITSLITLFGGTQLFIIGIFGEYLAKVYEAILGRPLYLIDEVAD